MQIFVIVGVLLCCWTAGAEIAPIPRRLPPKGISIDDADAARLAARLKALEERFATVEKHELAADVDVFLKAVALALKHGEFYKKEHVALAHKTLDEAASRIEQLGKGKASWATKTGPEVRGYYSAIDGSAQPYGVEVPEGLDLSKPQPVYVWLHGRGDKTTDMHYIAQRRAKLGKFNIQTGIVLHPFGRQCIGFKHAGEIDVLDVIADAVKKYDLQPRGIALMGFSMGGAGAWHIGAHYTDQFKVVHAGAGFAETAEYNRLTPEKYPAAREQTLWRIYDVPNYARNLFNIPVIAYSGEKDKQIQAARMMERAYKTHGKTLPHVIGPNMGHKYSETEQEQVLDFVNKALTAASPKVQRNVTLQTRTLRYNRMHILTVTALDQHWQDSRVDVTCDGKAYTVATKNVRAFELSHLAADSSIKVDGDMVIKATRTRSTVSCTKADGKWRVGTTVGLWKRPGLQGPIDDAFMSPFLVVKPDKTPEDKALAEWLAFELEHFRDRWSALMRGTLPEKSASEVTRNDILTRNLILWGTPETNPLIKRLLGKTPVNWTGSALKIGASSWEGGTFVPQMIYPNPEASGRYIVINSGLTFRENHDRTNSLQNPKLPDWAVIDISTPPDGNAPGRVVAADFFDERWKVKATKP
jgi:predicted esterase